MPQRSRNERKLRRIKVEKRKALIIAEVAIQQRDQARFIAGALNQRIEQLEAKIKELGGDSTAPEFSKDRATITVIEEPNVESN